VPELEELGGETIAEILLRLTTFNSENVMGEVACMRLEFSRGINIELTLFFYYQ
jgi:hypothetical protein